MKVKHLCGHCASNEHFCLHMMKLKIRVGQGPRAQNSTDIIQLGHILRTRRSHTGEAVWDVKHMKCF